MPPKQRRGSSWERRPQRKQRSAAELLPVEAAPPRSGASAPIGEQLPDSLDVAPAKWLKILDFAKDLWSADYRPFFQAEDEVAQLVLDSMPQTTYRARLYGDTAAAYDDKALKRARSAVSTLKRVANTRDWSFSTVARSLCWFNQRVPHRVWADASQHVRRAGPCPAWACTAQRERYMAYFWHPGMRGPLRGVTAALPRSPPRDAAGRAAAGMDPEPRRLCLRGGPNVLLAGLQEAWAGSAGS